MGSNGLNKHFLPSLIALTLLVSGCIKVGPDYVQPPAPIQQQWLESKDPQIKHEPGEHRDWWKMFKDPVLDSLVETAYQQNLTVRTAGIRILQTRAELGIAVGALYPQQQGASMGWRQFKLSEEFNPVGVPPTVRSFDGWAIGLDSAWELDFWGKFRRNINSATAGLEASIAAYDDVLVTLTAQVGSTYVQIRTLEERLRHRRENVVIQERSLRIADVRFRNGAVTELDVTQATSLLRDTQAVIPTLEASIRQAKNALSTLLGTPPGDLGDVLGPAKPIPAPPAQVAVGMPAELIRQRPDIRRAERQVAAQSEQIGIAKADLFPAFRIAGTIGWQATDFTKLVQGSSFGGSGGPSFRWNLFNYGRLRNNVRAQDALFQQQVVDYQNTVLRAYQEVEDATTAYLREQERVKFLEDSVTASRRSVDLALIQYRDGVTDYTRVLETQRALVNGQDSLADSQGNISLNLIDLYKALGGGWQIRVGKDFVPDEIKKEMRERT
ncbi:MAG: efflux transporter outer membrane subunit, partial [Deltaproteobacteria bacterium]|nr:efflux transporter outer membrane subunit [Deltaproteobacteria bacterium]